jgi:ElaB/YqjD/DUF883 family membrane-anchored ribosome-binding protein
MSKRRHRDVPSRKVEADRDSTFHGSAESLEQAPVAHDLRAERHDGDFAEEDDMEDRGRKGTVGEQPLGGWAQSEARDVADAARQRGQEAKHYAAEAREYAQGAVEQTREYVQGAKDYVEDAVNQARDKMTEYRDGGFEKIKHDLAGYTREQPMTALVIAAGAGLVLGWLSAIGRR